MNERVIPSPMYKLGFMDKMYVWSSMGDNANSEANYRFIVMHSF